VPWVQAETVAGVESWCIDCVQADPWMGYRLARWALVLGYHDLAASLLRRLVPKVQSTTTSSWMEALVLLAEAEDQLCAAAVASGGAVAPRRGGIAGAVSKLHQVCEMTMSRAIFVKDCESSWISCCR